LAVPEEQAIETPQGMQQLCYS